MLTKERLGFLPGLFFLYLNREKIRVKSESYDVRSLLLRVYRRTSAAAARIGRRSHPKKRRFFTCAFLSMSGKTPEMTDGRSCRPRAR